MNTTTDELRSPFICIPLSALDILIEYPPYVDRVYSHIIRRAGYDGTCWESISHMAKFLRIATGSTKRAIAILLKDGLITRESRGGTTSLYRITRNLGHNTGGVDQNIHPNLGHHMANLGHHMARDDQNIHPNLGHHMARGGHHMARDGHHMARGGSPHGHKLDPYKLDPNKLDPNKLKNHESDDFSFSENQKGVDQGNPIECVENLDQVVVESEKLPTLDQKPVTPDPVTPDPVMPNHLDQNPKPKTMPKPILKQRNSNQPVPPVPQIDQAQYDMNAQTTCPECKLLSRAFEIERWGTCSFCWQKPRTHHRSPLELINAS